MPVSSKTTGQIITAAFASGALLMGGLLPDANTVGAALGIGGNLLVNLVQPVISDAGAYISTKWLGYAPVRTAVQHAFSKTVADLHRAYKDSPAYKNSTERDYVDQVFRDLQQAGAEYLRSAEVSSVRTFFTPGGFTPNSLGQEQQLAIAVDSCLLDTNPHLSAFVKTHLLPSFSKHLTDEIIGDERASRVVAQIYMDAILRNLQTLVQKQPPWQAMSQDLRDMKAKLEAIPIEKWVEIINRAHYDVRTLNLPEIKQRLLLWQQAERERIFRDQLSGHGADSYSPLDKSWGRFITNTEWSRHIRETLQNARELSAQFSELPQLLSAAMSRIDTTRKYDNIVSDLRALVASDAFKQALSITSTHTTRLQQSLRALVAKDQWDSASLAERNTLETRLRRAEDLLSELRNLDHQVQFPHFNRCFLIMGNLGSGKTHFIASRLPADSSSAGVFVLPLRPTADLSIEQLILEAMRKITEFRWSSLRQLDEVLLSPARLRLVIALDDLQDWLGKKWRLKDIMDSVIDSTDIHSVYWLFALATPHLSDVSKETKFWRLYGHIGGAQEAVSKLSFRTSQRSEKPPISAGGWADLDELNRINHTGVVLLRSLMYKAGSTNSLALDKLGERADAVSYLASPFVAWVLWDLRQEIPISEAVNLNFMQFVSRYWEKIRDSIHVPVGLQTGHIEQCIYLIASFLAWSDDMRPPRPRLVSGVAGEAARGSLSALQDPNLASRAISTLEAAALLSTEWVGEGIEMPQERVQVRFEPFWALYLAKSVMRDTSQRSSGPEPMEQKAEAWFQTAKAEQLKEAVFEFFILLLDSSNSMGSLSLQRSLEFGLSGRALPKAVVWFAGTKASLATQQQLIQMTTTNHKYSSPRDILAFMHFMGNALPKTLDTPGRLSLLQPNFVAIHEAALDAYYLHIAHQLFSRHTNLKSLPLCLSALNGCEVLDEIPSLARLTLTTLRRLVERDLPQPTGQQAPTVGDRQSVGGIPPNVLLLCDQMLRFLISYLRDNPYTEQRRPAPGSQDVKWSRRSYREWLLHEFSTTLVNDLRATAFDFLYERRWYNAEAQGIHYIIAREMRREADLAFGYWYRTRADTKESASYVQLVYRLANSLNPGDKERAFFLIRHTRPTDGRKGIVVDRIFHDALLRIYNDPRLQEFVRRHVDDFKANLR